MSPFRPYLDRHRRKIMLMPRTERACLRTYAIGESMSFVLAVPSDMPGGLDAQMSMHFGHCDVYTLVTIEDTAIKGVTTLANVPHQQGGCMASVQLLTSHGVEKLLAGGMGMRPLMGFRQAGVEVCFVGQRHAVTVGDAVEAFLEGGLPPFSTELTCKGHEA